MEEVGGTGCRFPSTKPAVYLILPPAIFPPHLSNKLLWPGQAVTQLSPEPRAKARVLEPKMRLPTTTFIKEKNLVLDSSKYSLYKTRGLEPKQTDGHLSHPQVGPF